MVTDVQQPLSVPSAASPDITSADPNIVTSITAAQPSTAPKKKKKRKNTSASTSSQPAVQANTPTSPEQSNPSDQSKTSDVSPSSSSTQHDHSSREQSQQRIQKLNNSLNKAQKDNSLLASDLSAALARASDAENAEDAVNKGLLTARSVISQRDRTIAELKTASSNLRADLTHLQDEKKKTDKRLVLLKTVSTNLREAREARDSVDRKLEDANSEISKLQTDKEALRKQVESLEEQLKLIEVMKEQLARRKVEAEELSRAKDRAEEEGRRGEARALAAGAVGTLTIGVIIRILTQGRARSEA